MKQALYIIGYMLLLAAVFGSAVTGIHLVTQSTLEKNEKLLFQKALVEVFALGDVNQLSDAEIAELAEKRVRRSKASDPQNGRAIELFEAYEDNAQTRLKARGMTFEGRGFWDSIRGILAFSADGSRTSGLVILAQKETPGLGGRVAEAEFTEQFRQGIPVGIRKDGGRRLVIAAESATSGADLERRVDAITGATQTSMAMERILNAHLQKLKEVH